MLLKGNSLQKKKKRHWKKDNLFFRLRFAAIFELTLEFEGRTFQSNFLLDLKSLPPIVQLDSVYWFLKRLG